MVPPRTIESLSKLMVSLNVRPAEAFVCLSHFVANIRRSKSAKKPTIDEWHYPLRNRWPDRSLHL